MRISGTRALSISSFGFILMLVIFIYLFMIMDSVSYIDTNIDTNVENIIDCIQRDTKLTSTGFDTKHVNVSTYLGRTSGNVYVFMFRYNDTITQIRATIENNEIQYSVYVGGNLLYGNKQ